MSASAVEVRLLRSASLALREWAHLHNERLKAAIQRGLYPQQYGDVLAACALIRGRSYGDAQYHEGMAQFANALRAHLDTLLSERAFETPEAAVYELQDRLYSVPGARSAGDDLSERLPTYVRHVQAAMKRAQAKKKRHARRETDAKHPEYAALISRRAALKREIAQATREVRKTHEFRMMGGLHVLGVTARMKRELRDIEQKILKIERG